MKTTLALKPEDVLITPSLYARPARAPALEAELAAHRELTALMTIDPQQAIDRFLELAVELCPSAGSAGLSELVVSADGEKSFKWTAMSGALADQVGGGTARDFSPCGLCLDCHHTILVHRPGRVFTYFNQAEPEILEGLVVPLYDTGKRPLGTLWVTSHGSDATFDATDARIMEQLAAHLVLAIKLRRKAGILVQLEDAVKDREILVQEVRHRVKNMIQMTASLLQLQEKGAESEEARSALREAQGRLMVLASVYECLLAPEADVRAIDVAHLIPRLAQALRDTSPGARRVRIKTACDALPLGVSERCGRPDRQRSHHQRPEARLRAGPTGRGDRRTEDRREPLHAQDP